MLNALGFFRRASRAFARIAALSVVTVISAGVAQAQSYVLAPDDVIGIQVARHPEFSVELQTVPSSGHIQVPTVGDFAVAGKTTAQLAGEITRRLSKTLLHPSVTVFLRSQRTLRVFVLGAVEKTGPVDVKPGFRVSEVLALAGGLSGLPDQTDGFLNRSGLKPIALNLRAIYANGSSKSNLALRNGDVLQFNQRVLRVNVSGQVLRPGPVNVPIGEGIVQAISLAGGATPQAALSRVMVRRSGKELPVDLYKAIIKGQGQDTFKLRSGDLILVPKAQDHITVQGAVIKAGIYDIPDGETMRVSDALSLAGGASPRAYLSRAVVRHEDGREIPIDLYKISVLGLQDGNRQLVAGDTIVVPESVGVTIIGAVGRPGTYYVEEAKTPRISEVLAQSGGLAIKPEQARISITRRVTQAGAPPVTLTIDPVALLIQNSASDNVVVQDGDVITVSAVRSQTVFISGEVKLPGAYELREGDSLQALIARAGGPTFMASLRNVTVTRTGSPVQKVDALDAVKSGSESDVKLQDGDYVVVPENKNRVLVMAAVQKPDKYPIPEDRPLTVGEALTMAGGPLQRAKLKEIAILHQTPEGVKRRILPFASARDVQMNSNVVLTNGDILYVPEGGVQKPSVWDTITRGIGIFSVFGGL